MIKNIFIPEKIGSYYIFAQKIAGIDISHSAIFVTITQAQGNKRVILKLIEQALSQDKSLSFEQKVIEALTIIKSKLISENVNFVAASLPSSSVIFKELILPFIDLSKIKMVVPFEVESLLPFNLNNAIIDSIVISKDNTNKSSSVLVAAVKKDVIADFLDLFEQANIYVNKLSIDMFEIYSLFKSIPVYNQDNNRDNNQDNSIISLVDLGVYSTRIEIIINGNLRYIRNISKGIYSISKDLNNIYRFGVNSEANSENDKEMEEKLYELISEVNITIDSFLNKQEVENLTQNLQKKIILIGPGSDIPGISNLIKNKFGLKTEVLQVNKLVHNGKIESNVPTLPNDFLISIATSLMLPLTQDFNLQQIQQNKKEQQLVSKQIITALSLISIFFVGFLMFSFFRIRSIRNTVRSSEQQAIDLVKKSFGLTGNITSLKDANDRAKKKAYLEESAWYRLSNKNRYALLRYLIELSKCLNLQESQLDLSQIDIKLADSPDEDETVKLYGKVDNYNELNKLQSQLACPLFNKISKLQNFNFKQDPIILTINKQ